MRKRLLSFILTLFLSLGMLSGCSESETIETAETVYESSEQKETDINQITDEITADITEYTAEETAADVTEYTEVITKAVTKAETSAAADNTDECVHDYVMKKDFPATCQSERTAVFVCSKCKDRKTEVFEGTRLEHEYVEEILEKASSDGCGKREIFCINCGTPRKTDFFNYFNDIYYNSKFNAEADLAAKRLIDYLGLNRLPKSDLEKLCILKEWFCENTSYDDTLKRHTAYDILVRHSAVCQGYAEALCLILPKCGIETYFCKSDEFNHAWNLVKLDGEWVYTDFVGADGHNLDYVIVGGNLLGRAKDVGVREFFVENGKYEDVSFDMSLISEELHFYEFDMSSIEYTEEPGSLTLERESGGTKIKYKNN